MSSSNTTPHLGLNQWIGTDCPKMADFNSDNLKTDAAFHQHTGDSGAHVTAGEKAWLQQPFAIGTYTGTGAYSFSVNLGFKPRFLAVFNEGNLPYSYDHFLQVADQRFALATSLGWTNGVQLTATGFTVYQAQNNPAAGGTASRMNEVDEIYCYAALR